MVKMLLGDANESVDPEVLRFILIGLIRSACINDHELDFFRPEVLRLGGGESKLINLLTFTLESCDKMRANSKYFAIRVGVY